MGKFWALLQKAVPKLDLGKTENKLKLIILVSGLLILIGVSSVTAIQLTMSPQFCAKCHEMVPEYMTWQVTSHSNVSCTDCHIGPGVVNLMVHKVAALKELYLHVTDTYERPIAMNHPIENYVCEQCHSPDNRRFTVSGDLIIPHDRHSAKGIYCVDCHSGVAHGDIARRGVTVEGDLGAWTVSKAKQETVGLNSRPKMNDCLDCHVKREVTIACEACHTTIAVPSNHEEPGFEVKHGPMASEDISYCNQCHSFSLENRDGEQKGVAEYARGNVFCFNCHMNLPNGHAVDDWKFSHKSKASKDMNGCLVCHSYEAFDDGKSTKTTCVKCHSGSGDESGDKDNSGDGEVNSPTVGGNKKPKITKTKAHPAGWRTAHPATVKDIGTTGGKCYDCHARTHCYVCHTGGGST